MPHGACYRRLAASRPEFRPAGALASDRPRHDAILFDLVDDGLSELVRAKTLAHTLRQGPVRATGDAGAGVGNGDVGEGLTRPPLAIKPIEADKAC